MDHKNPIRVIESFGSLVFHKRAPGGHGLLSTAAVFLDTRPQGSKYPTTRHLPKTTVAIPDTETL